MLLALFFIILPLYPSSLSTSPSSSPSSVFRPLSLKCFPSKAWITLRCNERIDKDMGEEPRPPLWASQPGLRPSQPGLWPSQPDLRPSQPASQALGFRQGWLGFRPGWMAQRGEQTDRLTIGKSPHSQLSLRPSQLCLRPS